jgi:hypothetical protein
MARKKSRQPKLTGGARALPPKLADTDRQIRRLWHSVSEQCVSIASIDTTPPEMIPHVIRARWLRELRKTGVALAILANWLASAGRAFRAA